MYTLLSPKYVQYILANSKFIGSEIHSICKRRKELSELISIFNAWFSKVPEHKSEDIRRRFLNYRDTAHWSAFWEMAIAEYFNENGFEVEWGVDGEPDLYIKVNNRSFAIEIRGLYQSELEVECNRAIDQLSTKLNAIEFPTKIDIMLFKGIIKSEDIGYIEQEITAWLNSIKSLPLNTKHEKRVVAKNYDLRVNTLPSLKNDSGNLIFSQSIFIESNRVGDVRDYIRKKVKQARKFKDQLSNKNIPLIVALGNSSGFSINKNTLNWALYGNINVVFRYNKEKRSQQYEDVKRDNKGAIARSEYFSNPRNTRLSGVMYFDKQWKGTSYIFSCHLYENYWAVKKISPYDFGCPTFKPISEGSEGVIFGWVNRE